ncbi:MAG: leucine-rich repeat protein [Clostridiales bacterium]|nr:leucine-rich repeat protein [Clostridiales bacterium]
MRKKFLSLLIAAVMVLAMVPATAWADDLSGNCGTKDSDGEFTDAVKWAITGSVEDGYTLTISGSGAMADIGHTGDYATTAGSWTSYNDYITKIVVEDGITYIGNYAFGNMSSVTELSLGKDVESFGNWALCLMSSLTTINVSEDSSTFMVGDDGALYSTDGAILYLYPQGTLEENTSYTVPDDVTTVWKGAFKGASKITELDLNNVTTIGDQAFLDTGITTITVPSTVTSMGTRVFRCPNLVEAIYDASTILETQTFLDCTNLTTVTIGEHVTGVGNTPFGGCSSLTDVYFNASSKIESGYWFSSCTATNVTIYIGETCTYVPYQFARDFTGVVKVIFDEGSDTVEIGNQAFYNCTNLSDFEDEYERISIIGESAFQNTGLSGNLTLGSNVTEIGGAAFMGTTITSVEIVGSSDGVIVKGINQDNGAFYNLDTLTVARLANVTEIQWGAFRYDSNLVAVDLTNSPNLTTVSSFYPFYGIANESIIYVSNSDCAELFVGNTYNSSITVIAVSNGGIFDDSTTFEAGKLASPTKSGYKFEGWYTKDGTDDDWGDKVEDPEVGETYYAKWTAGSYTIVCNDSSSDAEFTSVSTDTTNGDPTSYTLKFEKYTYGEDNEVYAELSLEDTDEDKITNAEFVSGDKDAFELDFDGNYVSNVTVSIAEDLDAGDYEATLRITTVDGATHDIVVTVTVEQATPTLKLSESEGSYSLDEETFTFTYTYDGDGKVTVSSSDESIATVSVDEDEKEITVTLVAEGTATITVNAAKGTNYEATSATYKLTVTEAEEDDEEDNNTTTKTSSSSHSSYSLSQTTGSGSSSSSSSTDEEDSSSTSGTVSSVFTDLSTDHPYYDAIMTAYENGWMVGTSGTTFEADAPLTRAMAAKILHNLAGNPDPEDVAPFLDVLSGEWYSDAIAWAYEQGLIIGYDYINFGPDDYVTTEQFSIMLAKYYEQVVSDYVGGAPNATRGWIAYMITN